MRFPRACRACVGGDIRVQDRCISFISCFHAPVTEEDSWIAAWSPLQPAVHDAEGRASKDEKIDRVAVRPRGKNFPRDWRLRGATGTFFGMSRLAISDLIRGTR